MIEVRLWHPPAFGIHNFLYHINKKRDYLCVYKILYSAAVIFRLGCGRGTFLFAEILKVPIDLRAFWQKP